MTERSILKIGYQTAIIALQNVGHHDAARILITTKDANINEIMKTTGIDDRRHAVAEHPPGSCVATPVPMLLSCPVCGTRHVDIGHYATSAHHTHACQKCGTCWRPALCATVGMQFLPGFKNEDGS